MTLQERLRLWVAWLKRRAMIETAHVVEEAAAELDRLQARVAELEVDAERYQWLKAIALEFNIKRQAVVVVEFIAPIAYGPNIDAAIDTARKAKP